MDNLYEHMEEQIQEKGTLLNNIVMSQLPKGFVLEDHNVIFANEIKITREQSVLYRVDIENDQCENISYAYVGICSQGYVYNPIDISKGFDALLGYKTSIKMFKIDHIAEITGVKELNKETDGVVLEVSFKTAEDMSGVVDLWINNNENLYTQFEKGFDFEFSNWCFENYVLEEKKKWRKII